MRVSSSAILRREEARSALSGAADEKQSMDSLRSTAFAERVDVVVSCLASRTGGIQARLVRGQSIPLLTRDALPQDSWDIDYQATLNCLEAARAHVRTPGSAIRIAYAVSHAQGAKHFVLLSAICVQKPLLAFQKAKLRFEEALRSQSDLSHSIVRPTAFMKSLAGQVLSCKGGGPYVMFGDGELASCKARPCRLALALPAHACCAAHQRARPGLLYGGLHPRAAPVECGAAHRRPRPGAVGQAAGRDAV